MKLYAEQVAELLATEKNLRLQLNADGEKFQQFQVGPSLYIYMCVCVSVCVSRHTSCFNNFCTIMNCKSDASD